MAEPKKRTSDSVFDALQKISEEEDIDFGLGDYTADSFRQKYFTGPGNIENLYNKLNKISKEENIDFGQGTPDEWLASFGYKRNPDTTSAEKYVRTDGSSVVAPSSPSNAVTTSVEKPAVGSDAWRQQLIEIPGDNPYNGRSYGEAYDEIIQSFGKNISHPDVDPYAEARAQIMQSGITDDLNPDEAETLALNIREGYANQYAGINARAMVKQLPDQVPNIDQLIDGMWYNRELQGKLSHEAQRLGLSHENYVNFYMKPQLAKALKERYGYDVESAKQIAGRLLSGEQHTMERVRQGEANDMIESYAEPKLQEYFDRSLNDAESKFNAQMKINDRIGMDEGAMLGTALNYYSNTDPVKVWEEIKPNIETLAKDIVDVDFIIEADKHAEEEGVDVNTWLEGRIIPVLESQIQATFERMALEREMPKNTMDYLIANTRKSLVGTLLNAALASKARRRMQDEALARTEMGQGIYKPGYGAVVAGGVSAMLPDMLYGGPFGLVSKVATKPVQGMAQALIADGIRPLAARMAQSAASGSLSLGAFEAIKGGVEGGMGARYDSYFDEDQRSAGEILRDIVSGAFEHGVQSGLMGATMVGGPLGQKLSNGRGVLSNILGWGTQVGVDAAGATALTAATSIPEIVSGDVTLEDLGRDFAHNVGTFAALGLNHKAKEFASLTKGGRSWNGVEFTKKDIETLEGRFLQPLRTQITEIERAQNRRGLVGSSTLGIDAKEEQREAVNSLGAMMYNDLMHSYTIPRELKVKVAQALGMPIPEYALKPEVLQLEKDVTAKSIDLGWIDFMNNEYNKDGGVADKLRNGDALNDSELTLRLIFQDNAAYNEALKKQQAGEELSDQERELIETNDSRLRRMFMEYDYRERRRLASEFEKEHELEPGTIARMMRDAAEGKAVESELLSEYEQKLREYDEQLDAAEQERGTSPDGEGTVAEPDEEATGVVAGEEPKINRVTEEIPATTEDGKPDLTNNQTGTVIEVQLIDGRKAYVKDGDINDEAGLISLVDETGWPIVITDQNGYTHDQFAPSIIVRDEKGKPIINESKADGTVETSPDGEGTAAGGTSLKSEGTAATVGQPPRRPEQAAGGQPPKNPAQPAGPTAEQKIAQGTIKNNIGKRFGFTNQDGSHSEVTIELFKGDDKVVVTRQDYDRDEHPIGEPYRQDLNLVAVSNSIINGYMKPALTVKEKLGKQFKVTVGNVKLIDVLTDAEQQQLLDLYKKGDKEAIGNLTGDLIDAHHEDLILKGREERNDTVNRIMEGNGSREDKLRRVRKEYQGWEDSVISLSDEALQPTTLEEYVADLHSRQPRSGDGPLAYFSYELDGKEVVGMQDETGHGTKSGGDTKGYAPWLAPKGKGMSLSQYAETIHSQLPEAIQQQYSDQDVRNAILDVFGSAERPSDITTMIIRRGIVEAENAARRQEEMWIDGGPAFHKVTAEDHSFAGLLERAKQQTNAEPTDGQKRAGNYKKGRISFGGYDFVIENPEGSVRRGKDATGNEWEQKMHNTYGYILGKRGKDGDHLDMFINDDADLFNWNGNVYVVDQRREKLDENGKPTGEWEFDEHKIMYGFDSETEARDAYLSNYEDGWQGLGKITGVDKETFDKWLDSSDKKMKEFAEHSIVKEKINKYDGEKHIVTDGEIEKAFVNELGKALDAAGVPRSYDVNEGQPLLDRVNQMNMAEEGVMPDVNLDYHKVEDKKTLDELNSGKTVKRYRAMQLIDGKLYPPMSGKIDGKWRNPSEIGVWEQSEERPDLVKNGKFTLKKGLKGEGRGDTPAAYNPYFHTSTSALNDQFTAAYKRPELVVVEIEIPESELTSGYQAEGAKDHVGDIPWHSGPVNGQLPADRKRTVTLSRYCKVNRIVPDSEVAEMIAKQLEGTNIAVPYNVVTPALRAELEKLGVKISSMPSGTVTEDVNGNPIRQQKVDKPIFYSNAMRAVEGIKQEKATPEQWLAMIEKNGGLKAGEDKWIGLSDWLKSQDKKSLTKQEVMDYIRQNQIEVEEVPYSEYPDVEGNPKMQEFRDEFNQLVNKYETERLSVEDESNAFNDEMFKKYGQGWASDTDRLTEEERAKNDELIDRWHELNDKGVQDLAIQEMVDKYGDDFGMAFDVNYGNGRLEPVLDMFGEGGLSDAARYFLEIDEHPIHSTRLNFTTEGLENKKEIALTVPTVEPYRGKMPDVHFADEYTGGKTVAWARFGETYAPNMGGDPNSLADGVARTLVIDEIQSQRHQDAREKGYKGDISEADKKRISELRSGIKELDAKYNALTERSFKLRETIQKEQAKDLVDDEGVVIEGKQDEYFALFDNNKELNQLEQEKDGLAVQISDLKEQLRELERPPSNRVPDAPFEKNWHELAMKRMLRYAAENGYDKIAWTTGEQQAKRYSLENVVDEINAYPHSDHMTGEPIKDQYDVFVKSKGGGYIHQAGMDGLLTKEQILQSYGKDLGTRIMQEADAHPDGTAVIKGDGLKIGGEGMKGFYDDMLVRFMNKYGKKWGVKVEQTQLPEIGQTMWSIDVTPEMKESVMQGQPMFFKTPDGHAYGFTYKGKIYVDPRIATAETPIHEYGHLWAEMKRMTSPEEWNAIKDVLMHDKVIEPFIEKVKNDYPELTEEGMEDDFVEEVLTQYSGRRGAERLRQAAQEIKKELGDDAMAETIAEAAVRKVKGILNDFWKGVCDMMGWQYTSADDIADAILRDLLNGVNPNEKINEAKNNRAEDLKQRQLDIIMKENPADDENMPGHTWIRSLEDINTFKEALEYDGYGADEDITPDFTADMVKDVLEKGTVIVYSSKPIKNGAFVTPSKMEAQNYAGDGKIYSKEVSLTDVAWIDATQGQYAKVPEMPKTQLVGEIGASTADMREHTTSRRDSLKVAEEMEKAGKDARAIKLATGWERGKDGKWRYETVDADVDVLTPYYQEYEDLKGGRAVNPEPILKLQDLLGEDNELFKYYPDIKNLQVRFSNSMEEGTAGSTDGKTIELSDKEVNRFGDRDLDNENVYGILLHEVQHVIQEKEGFAKGGSLSTATTKEGMEAIMQKKELERSRVLREIDMHNQWLYSKEELKAVAELDGRTVDEEREVLKEELDELAAKYDNLTAQIERIYKLQTVVMSDARELYHNLAGEVEARNATERMGMSEAERRNTPISSTEDVGRDSQVVMMGDGSESASMGDGSETFDERQKRAEKEKGVVRPGLANESVEVLPIKKHGYKGTIAEATYQAKQAAKAKYAPDGKPITQHYDNYGKTFDYIISGRAISESLNPKQQGKSNNKGAHLAMAEHLDEIIGKSIEVEEHPDVLKNEKGDRDGSIINPNALMHRFYGVVNIDGETYRVMTLMREDRVPKNKDGLYAYEVQKIEVLNEKTPSTPNGEDSTKPESLTYPLAKLLNNVEKSKDSGKFLLDESKKSEINEKNSLKTQNAAERAAETEIGGALVDRLQDMGIDVGTDFNENRKVRKAAEKDNSEAGKIRNFMTPDGKVYGFTYKGKMYLDPRKIDGELPIHEYGHLWCSAFRKLNPEGWKSVVETMKTDGESWDVIKRLNPDLTDEHDIAEEMISKYSGERGAERLRAELERLSKRESQYASRWGNIYKNISKAIQDFWKQMGDFLHIQYDSPEQVYDQVMKDFADKVNPQSMVERYLESRNADYMKAAEAGDKAKAAEIFNEALRENIGNGITPYIAAGTFFANKELARAVKTRDAKAVRSVAEKIAPLIPKDAVLVPAPGHDGKATDMLDVANAVAEITGAEVADVLKSESRTSQYEAKKAGKALASAEMGITVTGEPLPAGKVPVVIDNVVDTGNTAEACVKALGKGIVVTLGDSADRYDHAASLKSAEPIVTDKNGNIVPLSKRFEIGGSKRLDKAPRFQKVGGDIHSDNFKEFFGDWEKEPEKASKVVDEEGKPLVVYHGGEAFDDNTIDNASSEAMYGKAFYATPSFGGAEEYAVARTGDKKNIQAVYIDVRHPFVDGYVDGFNYPNPASEKEVKALIDALEKKGLKDAKEWWFKWKNGKINGSILGHLAGADYEGVKRPDWTWWHASDIVQETLKELGYDGVIGMYTGDVFRMPQVAAFDMKQVKDKLKDRADKSGTIAEFLERNKDYRKEDSELLRDGEAKTVVLNEEQRKLTPKQLRARHKFAERQWRRAHEWADDTVKKLNLGDNVTIVDNIDELEGYEKFPARKKNAKGWYDPKTGKIVIVMDNHRSPTDVVKTILHEGVAHHGLRKLFGSNFDTFLDNAYKSATFEIRESIDELAKQHNGDVREATEEYMGRLAEDTDFEDAENRPWLHHWFNQIKQSFLNMLKSLGLKNYRGVAGDITDNELRYILWRSYKNLSSPGSYRNVFHSEDIAMQVKMNVGNYQHDREPMQPADTSQSVAEADVVEMPSSKYKRIDDFKKDHPDTIAMSYSSDGDVFIVRGDDATAISNTYRVGDLQEVDGVPTLFIPAQGRILDMLLPKLVRNGQKMALLDYDMESMEPSFSSFGPKSESYIDNYHEMRMAVKRDEIARLKSQIPQEEPLYNAWQNASTDAEREKARERYETYYKEHQDTIEQLESAAVELDEMEDGLLFRDGDETPRFQRVSDSDMPIEDRQSRKQWENAMKKWKERNALPIDAQEPTEKPVKRPDEDIMEYVLRLSQYNRDRAMWNTAPKLEDYLQVRDDKDAIKAAREYLDRYPDSPSAKMRLVAAEALRLRHAMSRQKAYDKATVKAVTDFAQEYMTMGFGDNLRRNEVARLLSSIKNATGAKDIRSQIDNIMNTLTDNYLRGLDQQVVKLSSIKELKLTAQGVEHQGKLELKGQRMIQAFREARQGRMTAEEIRNRLSDVLEYMSRNDEEAPMWEQEYEGLSIALQYAENIDGSRSEYKALNDEYRDAVKSYRSSGRSYKEQQEYLECLERSMMENKLERIGMFGEIINRLQGNIAESMEGAKAFVEREKERVRHIQDIANYDLAGMDMGAMRVQSKGKPANFFLQPLATFEQMLKQFGSRNAKGEGYLYNYFMRNWARSTDRAFTKEQAAKEELDEKAREVFGDQIKRWSDLYMLIRNEKDFPGMDVAIRDQNTPKVFHLNQGNLLYIYMANKMNDGAMKLRKMGITEEDVAAIEEHLDSRLVALGDWLQDDYLVRKRIEYNKVHERMFGAPMATIEHYYPIRVLADARYQEQDVNVPEVESLPSTITGNIIKRRRNTLPLDILHTDALSVAVEHIEDMERWAATAEFNRDINTLLSYTTFRNKVKNMKTIYGSGDALWNTFADTARMAAGTYRPKAKTGGVDKTITNIAKGVTAAKINFRMYTAFKQILSAPAFLHDVRIDDFVKNAVNPYGSWKWAMENMPMFQKRWKSRQAGDTRLMDDPTDWKMWKTNIVQMATRMGMSPNALVDGVTCAVGARSIYESRLRKYKEMGLSDEEAESRALDDAEIGYNLTQQSSEGAFVSAIQKDRTVAANMLSVFRNSSMAYTRQWVDAARNLKHRMQHGYKEDSIRFMKHQFMDMFGMDEDKALEFAEAEYARAGRHEVAKMLNMMFGVTIAWNLGASLPYLLMGDDDETKKEMMTDALIRGLIAGPTEGFAAGNIISELVSRSVASAETRKTFKEEGLGGAADAAVSQAGDYEVNPLPLFADLQGMISKMGYDGWGAAQDVFNIAMQSAVGVNPQTFTDIWNAAIDYGNPSWMPFVDNDKHNQHLANAKEIALFIMRVMNAPTSSWRNKYIDELGLDADEAQKLSYDEMAKRYAHYKQWKDTPFMGWLRGEEGRAEKVDKIRKQFDKAVQERMDLLSEEKLSKAYDQTDDKSLMDMIGKSIGKRVGGKDLIGTSTSKKDEVQAAVEYYVKNRTGADLIEDLQLEAFRRKVQESVDDGSVTQKQLDVVQELGNVINAIKTERNKMKPDEDNKEHWKVIREKREAILKKIADAK